ncbi:hypothetical protein ACW95P_04020, partial [Candidatus Mycoplasma pogonae]
NIEINESTKSSVNAKEEAAVYQTYNDYINSNLGFENENFKVKKIAENHFEKFYRMHMLINQKIWNFNQNNQEFSWNFNLDSIDKILNLDASHSNPYLWLFLDFKRDNSQIGLNKASLMNKNTDINWHFKLAEKNLNEKESAGIKISLELIKKNGEINIDEVDDVLIAIKYDSINNELNFKLIKKTDATKNFTDNILDALKNNKMFFSYFTSFLNFSFESNNDQNQTLEKFKLPSKYRNFNFEKFYSNNSGLMTSNYFWDQSYLFDPNDPFKINVNSNDLRTKEFKGYHDFLDKKYQNTYSSTISQIYSYNTFPLAEEMRIRTFGMAGTWTMLSKVKPSDFNDERYYVISNAHVGLKMSLFSPFQKIGQKFYKNKKEYDASFVNFSDGVIQAKDNIFLRYFWRFNYKKEKNKLGDFNDAPRDVQVSILDLKKLKIEIRNKMDSNINYEYWESVLEDVEKWPTLPPLKFTDKYANLSISNNQIFTPFFVNGYGSWIGYNEQIIHRMYTSDWNDPDTWLRLIINNNDEFSTLMKGNSGSLLIDNDGNVVGILALTRRSRSRKTNDIHYFYMFNDYEKDIIGANYGKYDPAENINPATLCHKIIQAAKDNPENFEVIPMCLPASG